MKTDKDSTIRRTSRRPRAAIFAAQPAAIFAALLATLLLTTACTSRPTGGPRLYVSILPLRGLVEEIVCGDFPVEVLVPPGASPETFEPTPRQIADLHRAEAVFQVGLLDFEQALLGKIDSRIRTVDLCRGIETLAGSCSHCTHGHTHAHGVDPHIWTAPRELRAMAANAYEAIHALWPDSAKYTAAHERLQCRLDSLDRRIAGRIARSGTRRLLVYHPALTYYARDYGLEQLAVETDGKEPSARQLARLIDQARESGIRHILYQSQFPASTVETVARDIGACGARIDPLAEDILAEIERITDLIVSE